MPISTDSDAWSNGRSSDHLEVKIEDFLRNNPETAFTAQEITNKLWEDDPEVFPESLLPDVETNSERAGQAQVALIRAVLDRMMWTNRVERKMVSNSSAQADKNLYFSHSTDGYYPIAEVEDVIPQQLEQLENGTEKLEEKTDRLDSRVARVEQRVKEELGIWR